MRGCREVVVACLICLAGCGFPTIERAGGTDATSGAGPDSLLSFCYGTGIVSTCFDAEPTNPLTLADVTVLNTDTDARCIAPKSGGEGYCVVASSMITISSTLRATGSRPLILVASDSITVSTGGVIDVSSKRGATPETGAGNDPIDCIGMPAPTDEGGGAGGSFSGPGGAGGNGNLSSTGGGSAGTAIALPLTKVRGGCPGQAGDLSISSGGHGGGAVYLIATTKITIDGTVIAGGEGGNGGISGPGGGGSSVGGGGGGGGGAGGMIGLDSPVVIAGTLVANGGGGGGGGDFSLPGNVGADAQGVGAAVGGVGARGIAGSGGAGSAGNASGPGSGGQSDKQKAQAGGGGGGGGAGLILAPSVSDLGTTISPAKTGF